MLRVLKPYKYVEISKYVYDRQYYLHTCGNLFTILFTIRNKIGVQGRGLEYFASLEQC